MMSSSSSSSGPSLQRTLVTLAAATAAITLVFFTRWRTKMENKRRRRRKKQGSVNIGGIFGMDVGGTLTKIVYFETKTGNRVADEFMRVQRRGGAAEDTREIPGRQPLRRVTSLGQLDNPDHQQALSELYSYMDSSATHVYQRDESLSFYSNILGGRLHFLHFETRNMFSGMKTPLATATTRTTIAPPLLHASTHRRPFPLLLPLYPRRHQHPQQYGHHREHPHHRLHRRRRPQIRPRHRRATRHHHPAARRAGLPRAGHELRPDQRGGGVLYVP